MSNIKTTPEQWATARAMFEARHKLEAIRAVMGASISSLSKRSKKEGWQRIASAVPDVFVPPAVSGRQEDVAKQVEALSSLGLIDDEIAAITDLSRDELREHYARELQTASPRLVAKVAQSLFKMATDQARPSASAAMYWLDRRGGPGWAEGVKAAAIGKKGERQGAAREAAKGRYAPSAPPKLVAVKR